MAGNSCIWRADTLGAESSNSDRIEFNAGSVPDNLTHITNSQFQLLSAIGINERPKIAVESIQDLGFSSLDVIITGSIQTPVSQLASHRIKKWLLESKTNTSFPKGRFGLRLDDYTDYNLVPTSTRAYFLYDAVIMRNAELSKLDFILKLKFNGDIGSLTSGEYIW